VFNRSQGTNILNSGRITKYLSELQLFKELFCPH
jgi:hypothetical protein